MLRKGAISAKENEKVIIPINMRDGIILANGLGNIDWNHSAPHGARRIMKRSEVKSHFTVSSYKSEMKEIKISSDVITSAIESVNRRCRDMPQKGMNVKYE